MGCDLCGKDQSTKQVVIEGVLYDACPDCSKYGKPVRQVQRRERRQTREQEMQVRKEFPSLIRKARGSQKQEQFAHRLAVKESVLHAWESGQRAPTLEQARKLEKQLHITLLEPIPEFTTTGIGASESAVTIGDLLKDKLR